MLISRAKKKTNIVEYLIYMYQIEDIIRSFNFRIELIEESVIEQYDQPDSVKAAMKQWYQNLISEMRAEGIEQKGHLQRLEKEIEVIYKLHQKLLTTVQDNSYLRSYELAKPPLEELALKSGGEKFQNEIELALHGLYGLLLLRLKGEKIAVETETGLKKVSDMMAKLAHFYHQKGKQSFSLSKPQEN